MPKVPSQFFIVPDPKVRTLVPEPDGSFPYEGGRFIAAAIAGSTNIGDMQAFGTGVPTIDFDVDVRIQQGGSVDDSTFIYKNRTDSDTQFYGEPDRRCLRDFHNPFTNYSYKGYGATAFLAPIFNREVVVVGSTAVNSVRLRYRDVSTVGAREDGGSSTWTEISINLRQTFDRGVDYTGSGLSDKCMIDATTTKDGRVYIAVKYQFDIDIYTTTDGITWSLVSMGILSSNFDEDPYPNTADLPTTYGRLGRIHNLRLASSGDFLRICFASYSPTAADIFLKVINSSNGGTTWTLVQDDITVEAHGISGGDRFGYDVVGIGNGQFLMGVLDQHYMMFRFYYSQGNSPLTYLSSLYILYDIMNGQNQAPRIYMGLGSEYIWCLVDNNIFDRGDGGGTSYSTLSGKGNELNLYQIPRNKSINEGLEWNNVGSKKTTMYNGQSNTNLNIEIYRQGITGTKGAIRYNFARGKLYNRGDCMVLFAAQFDNLHTQDVATHYPMYVRFGGWSMRPVNTNIRLLADARSGSAVVDVNYNPVRSHQMAGRLYNFIEWHTAFGAPAGILYASQWSPWEEIRVGSPTRNWDGSRLRITTYFFTNNLYYKFRDTTIGSSTNPQLKPPIPRFSLGFYALNYVAAYPWDGSSSDFPAGTVNGGCITFTMRCTRGGTVGESYGPSAADERTFPRGVGVHFRTYVKSDVSPNASDATIVINVVFNTTGGELVDVNAGTSLATFSCDFSSFYEFRLAIRPRRNPNVGTPVTAGTRLSEVILCYRKVGTDTWQDTGSFQLECSPFTSQHSYNNDLSQEVRFGNFQYRLPNSAPDLPQSEWRDFAAHAGSDFGAFDTATGSSLLPAIVRGRRTTPNEVLLDKGVSLVWGGSASAVADTFTLDTRHTNAAKNSYLYDSPRVKWSSGTAQTENKLTLSTTGGDSKEGIIHNAIAVFGTNAKEVTLKYGLNLGTQQTISMLRAVGRVENTEDNAIKVKWDGRGPNAAVFSSSIANRKFFVHFTNTPSSIDEGTSYLINRHYYDRSREHWLECAGVTMSFDTVTAAGMTVSVYADRGWAVYSGTNVDHKVQWVLTGSNWNAYEESNPDQELYAGTLVVGSTLSMHPLQISWQMTDDEKANTTVNRTRSGVTWGYREGATTRQIKGTFQGDVSEQVRRYLRDTLRSATNFNETGIVFVGYAEDPYGPLSDDYFMLSRFDDNLTLQNIGWYYDEGEQKWRPVGNLSLTLTEIV